MVDLPDGLFQFVPSAQIECSNEFAIPFRSTQNTTIAASSEYTFTFGLIDSSKIYQIQSINCGCSASRDLIAFFLVDDNIIWVGGFDRNLELPIINNPSLKLVSTNVVKVTVKNASASSANVYVCMVGTKFKKPVGFGQPPTAHFYVDAHVISVNGTIGFFDDSIGSITSHEYDFDDSTDYALEANPTHQFTVKGQYVPIHIVSNQYGSDYFSIDTIIGVANTSNLTGLTEVDASALLTVAANQIDFVAVTLGDTAYVYNDGGANYYNYIDFAFHVNVSSSADGAKIALFRLSNQLGVFSASVQKDIIITWETTGTNHSIVCRIKNAAGADETSGTVVVSLSTDYYIRIYKDYGSPTVYFRIYTDDKYYNLFGSYHLTTAVNVNTRWRYLYAVCSYGSAGAAAITGLLTDMRQVSP